MLIYWFLPMILFLGIITSYEDIKYGKIRNKWIFSTILIGAFFNLMLFFTKTIGYEYALLFIINSIISLSVSFIIWIFGFWTAGDAKLFFTYSFLMPLDAYGFRLFTYFPAASLLLLAFVPLALVYLLTFIISIFKKNQFAPLLKSIRISEIRNSLLFLFSMSWILKLIFSYVGISLNFSNVVSMILLFFIIGRISKFGVTLALSIIALLRLFLDPTVFLVKTWVNLLALFSVFFVVRFIIINGSFNIFTQTIKISNLKEGMISAELILKINDKYKKVPSSYVVSNRFLPKNEMLFTPKSKGLSRLDITKINKVGKKLPFDEIKINQTISFAPVLFFGAVVNVLLWLLLRALFY